LFLIVARDSGHPVPGFVVAGVYAAAYRFTGAWMDIGCLDSLFLCLVLAAFFVGRQYPNCRGMVISGLLYVLAYYTKQNVLFIVLVLAPFSLFASRGRTWPQWLSIAVVGPAVFLGVDAMSDRWFSYYTFDMMTYRTMVADIWFFWRSIISQMWPVTLLALFYVVSTLASVFKSPPEERLESLWHNLGLGCALLLSSWSTFLQRWAYANNFIPACAGLGMLAGLGYGRALRMTQQFPRRVMNSLFIGGASVLLLCQFATLSYNPFDQLPTDESREVWEQFIGRLSELPGEVLVFNHGFVNDLAGKNTYFHSTAYSDAVGGGARPPRTEDNRWRREKVGQVFEQILTQQVFDWVIAGGPATRWLPYYAFVDEDPVIFHPVTGPPALPENIMIRNPVARGGVFPLTDASYDFLLGEGWSIPEDWGRWAMGQRAVVQIVLEQGHDYGLTIEAFPFCPPEFAEQAMEVGWNDLSLGKHVFASCEPHLTAFELPSEAITAEMDTLWFEFEGTASPADVGLSGDQRSLSVGFTSLTFAQGGR